MDVQRLAGSAAAVSRFISRLLKKSDNFEWTEEVDAALKQLKEALTSPPILATPHAEEPMLLYVAATNLAVSAVMVVERKAENSAMTEQRPVYFISEVFSVVFSTPLGN